MYIKELMRWFSLNLFQLTTGGVRLGPRLSLGGLRVCVIEHEMQVIKKYVMNPLSVIRSLISNSGFAVASTLRACF